MVLEEPETSLHPDLLPARGRLILKPGETRLVGRRCLTCQSGRGGAVGEWVCGGIDVGCG